MMKKLIKFVPHKGTRTRLQKWAGEGPPVVAVLRLDGVIGAVSNFRSGLSISDLAEPIEEAFKMKKAKAVALVINSPGGSPVQSSLIFKRIRALAVEKELPVFAFVEDVAASGGYMLACAADEVYADESSIIGSIGVISSGFGFTGLIEKVGIERRVHTSGENKSSLDPFVKEDPEDVQRLLDLQSEVHESFKTLVRTSRGDRLNEAEGQTKLFTGEFWAAAKGAELGLIDGIGDIRAVMREKFGDKVDLRVVGAKQSWMRKMMGMSSPAPAHSSLATLPNQVAGNLAEGLMETLETKAHWSRFGL
ncbi:MAG: S49 family peptidase [Parvibaculaceae bacterium]|nr:S49 family peptidase [Parvibaculaceae bacterium]